MILDHVPEHARRVVIASPPLDPDRFRDGELDVVDVLAVPERLKEPVREAKREQVLHRILAEVVVDAKDLLFPPAGEEDVIERHRRGEVVPEGLLDDEPAPAAGGGVEAPPGELLRDGAERDGRGREIEEYVTVRLVLGVEAREDLGEPPVDAGVLESPG